MEKRLISRKNVDQSNLKVRNLSFEMVDSFKYLDINTNSSNNMHKEINEKLPNGRNKCYHSINKL